jgi:hypothetical protein
MPRSFAPTPQASQHHLERRWRSNDVAGPTQGRLTATPGLGSSSPLATVYRKQASGLSVFPARNKTVKRHLHQPSQVVANSTALPCSLANETATKRRVRRLPRVDDRPEVGW